MTPYRTAFVLLFMSAVLLTGCATDTIRNDPHPRYKGYLLLVPDRYQSQEKHP